MKMSISMQDKQQEIQENAKGSSPNKGERVAVLPLLL